MTVDQATGLLLYAYDTPSEVHDVHVSAAGSAVRLTDATATVDAGSCTAEPPHGALCSGITQVAVVLGDAPDRFSNDTALQSFACGGGGSDTLAGGDGNDTLAGGPGRDDVSGQGGRDLLAISLEGLCDGGAAIPGETLDGGDETDTVQGGPAADVLSGGGGDDSLQGFGGDDRISGGAGRDDLAGSDGDDVLQGGDDRDWLFGGEGNDRLEGGDGNDLLGGPAKLDADGLGGGAATTTLVETGDDILDGGAGDDTLIAGPGESVFDPTDPLSAERRGFLDRSLESAAPNGADVFIGGPGLDRVSYANRTLPVRVTPDGVADDGSAGEGDRVDADVEVVFGGAGDDVLAARRAGSTLNGDLGDDTLLGDDGPDVLRGGPTDAGRDVLLGAGGDDDLAGGGGDDRLEGGPGADTLAGDDGGDVLLGDAGDDRLAGGSGDDRLEGGEGADCLTGFAGCGTPVPSGADGDDTLAGGPGRDRLEGGAGTDLADYAEATGPVLATLGTAGPEDTIAADVEGVRGGPYDDTLVGDARDNLLIGGAGDDLVVGGAGADRLQGGSGADVLVAPDEVQDEVRCGAGSDLAAVDDGDAVVALRADRCELADTGAAGSHARVLASASCPARLRLPASARRFSLAVATAVPWHTRVLPAACGARVQPPRTRTAARARGGAFSVERGRRGAALTLTLRGAKCPLRLSVTAAGPLLVDARRADTLGAHADWTVSDRCDATRVAVTRGRVRLVGGRTLRAHTTHVIRERR